MPADTCAAFTAKHCNNKITQDDCNTCNVGTWSCCACNSGGSSGFWAENQGNPKCGKKRKREVETTPEFETEDLKPIIDFFLNPNIEKERRNIYKETMNKITKVFSKEAMIKMYSSMFQLLWYSTLPCFHLPGLNGHNILHKCTFHGIVYNCNDLFKTSPTDQGMCCSFNAVDSLR